MEACNCKSATVVDKQIRFLSVVTLGLIVAALAATAVFGTTDRAAE
jgi:hypothetical protein